MTLAPGQTLAGYEILGTLGAGSMGEVYRACDTRLAREVAIKVLPEPFAADEERIKRFEREAKSLASLNHPRIAQIYGIDRDGSRYFLALELVPGESLEKRLARGPMSVEESLEVCQQIAEGLEAAHEAGVIHRDLKPANVCVTPDGKVKLLDFGLAKPTRPEKGASSTESVLSTEQGRLLGTPTYMAPEQARGRSVDRRVDVWALGCVLFECLTARRAFSGETTYDVVAAVLERDPDWSLLPASTPQRVRELLADCLVKDPARRVRDVGDVRLALERAIERRAWTGEGSTEAQPRRRSWRAAAPWAIAGFALAALAAVATWRSISADGAASPAARRPIRFTVNEPEVRHLHTFDLASLAVSADGSTVVYTGAGPGGAGLHIRRLDELTSRALAIGDAPAAHNPAISPDGRWIAFARLSQILKVPVDGGEPVPLFDGDVLTKGHCWTAQGILFSPRLSSGLARVGPDGGPVETLTTPDAARGEVSHRWPDALPDGRHVLFTVKKSGMATFDDADVALLDLETKRWRTIIEGGMFARYSPTGHVVYARADTLLAVPFDVSTGEIRGAPIAMVKGVVTEPGSGAAQFALARDAGTLVYVPGVANAPQSELIWIDLDGTVTPIGAPRRNYSSAAVSPDGTRFALGVYGASDSIVVYDLSRGTSTRVTFDGNAGGPFWSLDGRRIGFESDRDGTQTVCSVNADGSGTAERLAATILGDHRSFVELGGREAILFARGRELWVKPRDGEERAILSSPFPIRFPSVSPDQRWLAYVSGESGQDEVYVRPFPSGEVRWQVSLGGGDMPEWLASSDALSFRAPDDMIRIARRGPNGFADVRPEDLCRHPENVHVLSMLPDGSRFFALREVPPPPSSGRVEAVVNWFEELKARVPASGG